MWRRNKCRATVPPFFIPIHSKFTMCDHCFDTCAPSGPTICPTQADQAIETPLYFSLDRDRLLGEVSMPTNEPQDVWILAGVALFLKD